MRYSFLATAILLVGFGAAIAPPAKAETRCRWESKVMICQDLNSDRHVEQRYEQHPVDRPDSSYSDNRYNDNGYVPSDNRYDNSSNNYDNNYFPSDNRYDEQYDNRYSDRNGVSGQINQLYRDVFGRNADDNGMRNYINEMNNGKSLAWVRERLAESSEARDAVSRVYLQVLGRNADPGGIDSYTRSLRNGWTLTQVRAELAKSTEARNARRR